MDLARAKGEALVNILIIYSNEKYNRVMLNGVSNENGKKDNNNNNFARAAHFFVHLFAVVACVPVRFFFSAAHFHLAGRYWLASHFLTAGIKFSCCCSNEIRLRRFLSLALALCRSFSRWASLACRLLSRFLWLYLSQYSKFVDMTINLNIIG